MPVSFDDTVRRQQDRARREPRRPDEPSNLDASSRDSDTQHGAYAGFDDDLNPIDDDLINTHGSER